jgi:hypothetical protein
MNTFLNNNWLKIAAIVLVLGAISASFSLIPNMPYFYYQLMNWAVAGSALMIVWQALKRHEALLMWMFAIVAVIFNPLAPIYLNSLSWQIADIVTVLLLISSFIVMKDKKVVKK